jgi:Flp pilus assembly protein TadD
MRTRINILKIFILFALSFCVAVLFAAWGCSTGALDDNAESSGKWICKREADEAMTRQDYERAIPLHKRVLRKEPGNALALYHLGYAYGRIGDLTREVSFYEKAIALGFKKDHIFFNLGMAYGEMDQIDRAIIAFKTALELEPNDAESHYGLAMAYQRNGQERLAEQELLKAIEIDPGHVEARSLLLRLNLAPLSVS